MNALIWFFIVISILQTGCTRETVFATDARTANAVFREAAAESGLIFRHFTGAKGAYYLPEIMGAGAALFDYDNDGDLDVYLLQGASLDGTPVSRGGNRLFRNDLIPTGRLRFSDVSQTAGVSSSVYGMGAATGDYDGDGDLDLYVTAFGPNVLYRNNGNGTFTDVTREAGVGDPRWSASAAFVDYDRDGDLDLFVTNYVDFTTKGNIPCYDAVGARDYCNPSAYRPTPARLYRNEGNRSFRDVTARAGIAATFGRGLGVICGDFNRDGWPDILVANDGTENQLWINQQDGSFRDVALSAGIAYNADGVAQAGMGVTADDFDEDGDDDVFISHLVRETHTLFLNEGRAQFHDATVRFGLAVPSYFGTGFGTRWFDYDNDGWLDLFVANGAVTSEENQRGSAYPYGQRNQLFRNEGGRRFRDISVSSGPALELSEVSRGAAFGDIDNDGDIDILVTNNNGPVRLLLNEVGSRNSSLTVRLEGPADGARLIMTRLDGSTLHRRSHSDGSYLSASDGRVHVGLGRGGPAPDSIAAYWPDGRVERWGLATARGRLTLRYGTGTLVK